MKWFFVCPYVFIFTMHYFLELLIEAKEQLIEMWKAADDSVADYTLQIETAVNFIRRALRTQNQQDIKRALQKAYEVLEREEGAGEPDDHEYDRLVQKLRNAITDNMVENIQYTILKSLIKETIKEIYSRNGPRPDPITDDPEVAKERLITYISKLKEFNRIYLRNLIQNEYGEAKETATGMKYVLHALENIFAVYSVNKNRYDLIENMSQHIRELYSITVLILQALNEKNYIIIKKDVERLNDIFNNMKQTVDELFEEK